MGQFRTYEQQNTQEGDPPGFGPRTLTTKTQKKKMKKKRNFGQKKEFPPPPPFGPLFGHFLVNF